MGGGGVYADPSLGLDIWRVRIQHSFRGTLTCDQAFQEVASLQTHCGGGGVIYPQPGCKTSQDSDPIRGELTCVQGFQEVASLQADGRWAVPQPALRCPHTGRGHHRRQQQVPLRSAPNSVAGHPSVW